MCIPQEREAKEEIVQVSWQRCPEAGRVRRGVRPRKLQRVASAQAPRRPLETNLPRNKQSGLSKSNENVPHIGFSK